MVACSTDESIDSGTADQVRSDICIFCLLMSSCVDSFLYSKVDFDKWILQLTSWALPSATSIITFDGYHGSASSSGQIIALSANRGSCVMPHFLPKLNISFSMHMLREFSILWKWTVRKTIKMAIQLRETVHEMRENSWLRDSNPQVMNQHETNLIKIWTNNQSRKVGRTKAIWCNNHIGDGKWKSEANNDYQTRTQRSNQAEARTASVWQNENNTISPSEEAELKASKLIIKMSVNEIISEMQSWKRCRAWTKSIERSAERVAEKVKKAEQWLEREREENNRLQAKSWDFNHK